MRLNYEEVKLIVKSYDKFKGDLSLVKSDFYNKTKKNIEYEHILKIIYKINLITKKNIQKRISMNNSIYDLFIKESKIAV